MNEEKKVGGHNCTAKPSNHPVDVATREARKVEPRNVTLYPSQWAIVEAKAAESGNPGNTSAGLRALIAEYQRLKANGQEANND